MTREELREYCLKQIEDCEMWAKVKGKEPSGKVYEEHKLILELLEQNIIFDKVKAEVEEQEKWLMSAGYNAYNVGIAFDAIKLAIAEREG